MRRLITVVSSVAVALFATACSKPAPESAADESTPAESSGAADAGQVAGSDPVAVDPDHYAVEFENDRVRVLRINYGPGEESVQHYHPDSVAVFMTDIDAEMVLPDGTIEPASAPAGTVVFNPANEHLPRNNSDAPFEVVEIELKPGTAGGAAPGGPDPTVVDADHYTTEFENDAVRVVRIAYGDGEASVMHYHPDSVAVFLTDHLVEMTMPDGSTQEVPADAGDVMFIPGGQHLPKNVAGADWELVLVELK